MASIRKHLEARERQILAPQAAKSADTRGRLREEPEDDVRPAFQRDRDRIVHSKAFRRLKHKTQVFFAPTGDHYRTRLTHTLEVAQISRTIAKVLQLHEELTEAIALGHDLGHTPFGHAGERVLDELIPGGFNHYQQSLRIVDVLENDRQGLNLTWEVRDGIAHHSKGKGGSPVGMPPSQRAKTLEGQIVRVADLTAYVNHDIDDAQRAGILRAEDLPKAAVALLGVSSSARIGRMVKDVVEATFAGNLSEIRMSARCARCHPGAPDVSVRGRVRERGGDRRVQEGDGHSWRTLGEDPRAAQEFLDQRTIAEEGVDAAARDFLAGHDRPLRRGPLRNALHPQALGWADGLGDGIVHGRWSDGLVTGH